LRTVYTAILYLLLPLVMLRLLWRGIRAPAYWRRWSERFGYFPTRTATPTLWIHAVSVGEAIAAFPLVTALRSRYPQLPVVMTTTTPTGSARVREQFGTDVAHGYLPYDLPSAVQRFIARTRPVLAVVMETEIWPNLFHHCQSQHIPIVIANARLSERSARRYQRIAALTRRTLSDVTLFAVQTAADAARFQALGAAPTQLRVTGNIKFDINIPADARHQAATLRAQWGAERPVWIAASTHAGEDEPVLAAYEQIRASVPQLVLILVPRHPERFDRVAALCVSRGFHVARRSLKKDCDPSTEIYVGDTMGELRMLCAAANIAFVGGSLVAVGGHNVLEPAALGIPVLFGPHMFNFVEAADLLLAAGAAVQVEDSETLARGVLAYLLAPDRGATAGANGLKVVEENRGALRHQVDLITGLIDAQAPAAISAPTTR
jgi:3-deoxy-D-manno-octulosonic-acid transferase